jgi:hypothetical protein
MFCLPEKLRLVDYSVDSTTSSVLLAGEFEFQPQISSLSKEINYKPVQGVLRQQCVNWNLEYSFSFYKNCIQLLRLKIFVVSILITYGSWFCDHHPKFVRVQIKYTNVNSF